MNVKMTRFLKKKWTSQMVANAKHQRRTIPIYDRGMTSCIDYCQRWSATPQGHDYWSRIQCYDC